MQVDAYEVLGQQQEHKHSSVIIKEGIEQCVLKSQSFSLDGGNLKNSIKIILKLTYTTDIHNELIFFIQKCYSTSEIPNLLLIIS